MKFDDSYKGKPILLISQYDDGYGDYGYDVIGENCITHEERCYLLEMLRPNGYSFIKFLMLYGDKYETIILWNDGTADIIKYKEEYEDYYKNAIEEAKKWNKPR